MTTTRTRKAITTYTVTVYSYTVDTRPTKDSAVKLAKLLATLNSGEVRIVDSAGVRIRF